jgi:hypothetical protein
LAGQAFTGETLERVDAADPHFHFVAAKLLDRRAEGVSDAIGVSLRLVPVPSDRKAARATVIVPAPTINEPMNVRTEP